MYIGQLHGPPAPNSSEIQAVPLQAGADLLVGVHTGKKNGLPYPVPKARNPLFAMPAVSIHVHVFIASMK